MDASKSYPSWEHTYSYQTSPFCLCWPFKTILFTRVLFYVATAPIFFCHWTLYYISNGGRVLQKTIPNDSPQNIGRHVLLMCSHNILNYHNYILEWTCLFAFLYYPIWIWTLSSGIRTYPLCTPKVQPILWKKKKKKQYLA